MATGAAARRPCPAVVELGLPALTVTFGLQLLRLEITTVISVERDRLGAPITALAGSRSAPSCWRSSRPWWSACWDRASRWWTVNGATIAIAALLAAMQLWLLSRFLAGPRGLLGILNGGASAGAALPLAGFGPALFLESLVLQNIGWQAVLGRLTDTRAFLAVMLANLVALAIGGTLTAKPRRPGWAATLAGVALVAASVGLQRRAGVVALFCGQAGAAVLLVAIFRCAALPGERRGSARTGGAWALGAVRHDDPDAAAKLSTIHAASASLPEGWSWRARWHAEPAGACARCAEQASTTGPDSRPWHPFCWGAAGTPPRRPAYRAGTWARPRALALAGSLDDFHRAAAQLDRDTCNGDTCRLGSRCRRHTRRKREEITS